MYSMNGSDNRGLHLRASSEIGISGKSRNIQQMACANHLTTGALTLEVRSSLPCLVISIYQKRIYSDMYIRVGLGIRREN